MKKIKLFSLIFAATLVLSGCGAGTKEISLLDNSEIVTQGLKNNEKISNIGDPYLVVEDGKYYVTATGDGVGYDIYSSTDLMNWEKEGRIFSSSSTEGWVRSSLWQPQLVIGNDGNYYLYYCGNNSAGSLRIGVAVADNILGPYKDVKDAPLVDFGVATIDPFFFTDDDGSMYLFFSRDCSENYVKGYNTSQIYGIAMKSYTEVADEAKATLLITPDQDWELLNGNYRWNEGPDMRKLNGKYYLFYSGGYYGDSTYSIGYAVADSPLGPYEKYENNPVIASTDDTSGPGNNSFFYDAAGEEMYTCYHTHTIKIVAGGNRKVTIDRCGFREDGTFYMNGPTTTYQTPVLNNTTFTKIKDFESVTSNALIDGETLNSKNEAEYECKVEKSEDTNISFSFATEETFNCIYIYGTKDAAYAPASLKITFDDGTISSFTVPAASEAPTVLYFDPVTTKNVKIEVNEYGEATGLALSEVIFYNYSK